MAALCIYSLWFVLNALKKVYVSLNERLRHEEHEWIEGGGFSPFWKKWGVDEKEQEEEEVEAVEAEVLSD